MIVIEGLIWPGATAASLTVSKQLALLESYVPEASLLHPATINVLLSTALRVTVPDIVTPPLSWLGPNRESERFALTRIGFEYPIEGAQHQAWIYTTERSPNRLNMLLVEILAPWIEGINYRQPCKLHIDRAATGLVT
jgi:hypothetical protein